MYRIWILVKIICGCVDIVPYFDIKSATKHYKAIESTKKRLYELRFDPMLQMQVNLILDGVLDQKSLLQWK